MEKNHKTDIGERSVIYSLRIIKLFQNLKRDDVGRILGKQLLRSATSIGANIQEAQGGQSKADFISKISIAHKEAYESAYWLRLVKESSLMPTEHLSRLIDETSQIIKILSSILITSKKRKNKE